MARIAISYRRSDTQAMTGRIFDRLVDRYGDDSVFMDIDKIPFGFDFRDQIREVLQQSDIVIVVIGPAWLGPLEGGKFRIGEEADPVRFEMETALALKTPLIPVLVNEASMPKAADLPESLKPFVYFNAAEIDAGRDFRVHMDRLMKAMDQILARRLGSVPADVARRNERSEPGKLAEARMVAPDPLEVETKRVTTVKPREAEAPIARPRAAGPWTVLRDAAIGVLAIGLADLLIVIGFGPSAGSAGELSLAICSALVSGLVGMAMYRRHRFLGVRAALIGATGGVVTGTMIVVFLGSAVSLSLIFDRLTSLLSLVFIGGTALAAAIGSVVSQWRAYRQATGGRFGILARGILGAKPR